MGTKLLGWAKTALMKLGKKSKSKLSNTSTSYLKANYITDIGELDMERYRLAIKGNYEKLRRIDVGNKDADVVAMEMIEQSFIDYFGIPDRFARLSALKMELAQLRYDYIVKDKRINLNFIKQKERQIEAEEEKMKGGVDVMKAKTLIEKWMKVIIDLRSITVLDFYTKLKEYERNS